MCVHQPPLPHVDHLRRLIQSSVHRRPAFRLEVDTLRRAVRADAQGQTTARRLDEEFG